MKFDVTIVGGGMVGATLACALQPSGLRIALIDAAPADVLAKDHRFIALNDASVCLFENINIWPLLLPHAAPIKTVHVSQQGAFGKTEMHADEMGLAALGYVVPAKYINQALYAMLENDSSIALLKPAELTSLSQDNDMVHLTVSTEKNLQTIESAMVVGADGTHSSVRQMLEIEAEQLDYQQSALVTTTDLKRDHQNIAYERFQSTGAIAMLPLTGKKVATIWTGCNESIAQKMQLDDAAFLSELQTQFGYRLGSLVSIGKRYFYPLKKVRVKQQAKKNVLLIGNAAHTLHPIAAQGLNLAFYEIAKMVAVIQQKGLKNSVSALEADSFSYPSISQTLSHQLTLLFSNHFSLVRAARQFGCFSLDMLPSMKRFFMKHATGRTGIIPPLLIRGAG